MRGFGFRPQQLDIVHRGPDRARAAAHQCQELLLQRREQTPSLRIRIRREHIQAQHHMRLGQLLGRLEGLAIQVHRLAHEARREVRGKRERQAHCGRQLRAEQAGPEQPQRHLQARAGHRTQALAGTRIVEVRLQLLHVLREGIGRILRGAAAQRPRGGLVGARRAAQAKVDAAGEERRQRAELLCHHQR